jgi:hypothetical protein
MLTNLPNLNIPTVTTYLPYGGKIVGERPGHTLSGLLHKFDPFIRYHGTKLRPMFLDF